ncbi:unnamed protein product [Microthlaspi erraticum]|uniref:Uncharacterized protein n=1 Tax=Microthlaspi erraticum TaxID=1685480 RepID=A0A6D2JV68_9BRAS|nr:unnamed protein product [Microthlaspi erraticum]
MFRARPKFNPVQARPITHTTRETCPAVGQATITASRARPRRASREVTPRGRATHVPGRCAVRPGKPSHVRPETIGQSSSADHAADTKHPATTVPTPIAPRPDCPADRPDRPSERRGRPEAVFEAQSAQFKPKAGAD